MPNDRVEINYAVTGTAESVQQIDKLNASVKQTGDTASAATTPVGDVGTGISGLSAIIGQVNPGLGTFIGVLESAKIASQGLENGVSNLKAAGGELLKVIASPTFITLAATTTVITGAYRAWKQEAEAVAKVQADINRELRDQAKLVNDAAVAAGQKGRGTQESVAFQLQEAGAPGGLADDVLKAVEVALGNRQSLGLNPDELIAAGVRVAAQTQAAPSPQELLNVANVLNLRSGNAQLKAIQAIPEASARDELINEFVQSQVGDVRFQDALRNRVDALSKDAAVTGAAIDRQAAFRDQRINAGPGAIEARRAIEDAEERRRIIREEIEAFGVNLDPERIKLQATLFKGSETQLDALGPNSRAIVRDLIQAGQTAEQRIAAAEERIRQIQQDRSFGGYGNTEPIVVNYQYYGPVYNDGKDPYKRPGPNRVR